MNETIFGVILIALGLSFAYKCIVASFFGRVTYWDGFLPLSIISIFFVHLPASEKSLIKVTHQGWVHVVLGPVFFFVSAGLLAAGADLLHMPGTQAVNHVLTLGRDDVPPAIVYEPGHGYQFPIIKRVGDALFKAVTSPVGKGESMTPDAAPPPQQ